MEAYMWAIWLGVFVLAVIIEASTAELLSIFFAIGAVISLIISFIPGASWWVQIIVFMVISGATLLGLRPLMNKYLKKEKRNTNIDEMVGKKGLMIKGCDELNYGEIKVNGVVWTAISEDEKVEIKENEKVTIVAVKGNKLVVRKENK